MPIKYSRAALVKEIEAAAQDNINVFYRAGFINFSGRATDTGELYTEIVAEWVLQNLNVLQNIGVTDRKNGYLVKSHNGQTKAANSNRAEERIAMALFRKHTFKSIGLIIDYQTPLSDGPQKSQGGKEYTTGKIDLLSYDGKIVRLFELKKPDDAQFINSVLVKQTKPNCTKRPESMLRCVLEGYTYLHTIENPAHFINCFPQIKPDAVLRTSPLVFKGSTQWKQMHDSEYQFLRQLMNKLNVQPFYITGDCEANFDIIP